MEKFLFSLVLIACWLFSSGSANGQCTLNPPLDLGGDIVACAGSTITLDAGPGYASYIWSTGATSQTITVTSSGMYFIRVEDSAACVGTDTVILAITDDLNVDFPDQILVCAGDSIELDAGNGQFTYEWQDGTTDQILPVFAAGTYWVTITNFIGCKASDTVEVIYTQNPQLVLDQDTTVCEGDFAIFDAGEGYQSYIWSNGFVGQTLSVGTAGSYTVIVTDSIGCSSEFLDEADLTVVPIPNAPTLAWDGNILTASGGFSYQWFFEGSLISGVTGSSYEPTQVGNYTVTSVSAEGCVSPPSSPRLVIFTVTDDQIVQVFTPNNDGINEVFYIENIDLIPNSLLIVKNRWGQEVYRSEEYANDWTGVSSDGKTLPEGTYFYILEIRNGTEDNFSGFVEIRR